MGVAEIYTLTNWTRRTDSLYASLAETRAAMAQDLHDGDQYTIWSMVAEGGVGEAIEDGIYHPT